jgi:hypothetical protein
MEDSLSASMAISRRSSSSGSPNLSLLDLPDPSSGSEDALLCLRLLGLLDELSAAVAGSLEGPASAIVGMLGGGRDSGVRKKSAAV